MERERLVIYTPDREEKTVYSICNQNLTQLLKITLLELFSIKENISPKGIVFKDAINSPIKILKNKSNLTIQTSKIVSMNELTFECKTQMPSDLHEQCIWKPLCEDLIELNISHQIINSYKFSIFAVKNSCDSKHYFFIDLNTLRKVKQLTILLSCFLEENFINKSFTQVYKKIMNNGSIDDIIETLNKNETLKHNHLFIMTCIAESQQPENLLISFLNNNIIDKLWNSGDLFFNYFEETINTSSEPIKQSIINTYNKFILHTNLQNNLNTCQNKEKCVKI